jgi:uncharacterized protein (TIGR03435 family)
MHAHLKLALTFVAALTIQPNFAQAPAAPAAQTASAAKPILFEVVSVRISNGDSGGYGFTADGIDAREMMPAQLIGMAYQFRDLNRIPGLQPWCVTDRYDVRAKVAEQDVAAWQRLDTTAKSLALQSLLEDRFHLRAHRGTKEGRIYELVIAKNGPKFKPATPVATDPDAPPQPMRGGFVGQSESMDSFAARLPAYVSRPVVNETGLAGNYEFRLKLLPEENSPQATPGSSDSAVIYALQEQLGLDLKSATGPVETLVIDHIEKPTEN